jgi:hypothetical protein
MHYNRLGRQSQACVGIVSFFLRRMRYFENCPKLGTYLPDFSGNKNAFFLAAEWD